MVLFLMHECIHPGICHTFIFEIMYHYVILTPTLENVVQLLTIDIDLEDR